MPPKKIVKNQPSAPLIAEQPPIQLVIEPTKPKPKPKPKAKPPAVTKFQFQKEPVTTKAKFKGQAIQKFRISVKDRNATINSTNDFISSTMSQLFKSYKPTAGFTKVYRVMYKLSGGQWFSTPPISADSAPELFYPDLHDERYNMNHNHELVEFVNITMVNVPNNEVNTITKYFKTT